MKFRTFADFVSLDFFQCIIGNKMQLLCFVHTKSMLLLIADENSFNNFTAVANKVILPPKLHYLKGKKFFISVFTCTTLNI